VKRCGNLDRNEIIAALSFWTLAAEKKKDRNIVKFSRWWWRLQPASDRTAQTALHDAGREKAPR
jgi:hypothetical protein